MGSPRPPARVRAWAVPATRASAIAPVVACSVRCTTKFGYSAERDHDGHERHERAQVQAVDVTRLDGRPTGPCIVPW